MARYELVLPAMGEGIIEATITRWLVSDGQQINIDQPLVEVATDKVDSEIPSPVAGTVIRKVYREGEIPRVGEVIALLETATPGSAHSDKPIETVADVYNTISPNQTTSVPKKNHCENVIQQPDGHSLISPLVRMLAKQRGLSPGDLMQIQGTGLNRRITKDDINHFIMTGRLGNSSRDLGTEIERFDAENNQSIQEPIAGPDDEVMEMDRMRRLIAANLTKSKRIAPHVTSFLEADLTAMVDWREKNKVKFLNHEKVKLTFTPIFIEIVALALKEFPGINIAVSDDSIIVRKNINIGVATALPDGNLIVPVIKNADHKSLSSLAQILTDLAKRARNSTLLPSEIKGGTFTVTNIGQYNSLTGTPIINQPESAILAVGTITKKPWAIKTPAGYGMAIRDIIMLSLTYDHRVIDGALGGSFLSRIVWHLENFNTKREV
jgi:2-oxoglutarate dehydrogenase E2 component (dihydrolipoamide succinyltransferase)